jgi:hypothetical protein
MRLEEYVPGTWQGQDGEMERVGWAWPKACPFCGQSPPEGLEDLPNDAPIPLGKLISQSWWQPTDCGHVCCADCAIWPVDAESGQPIADAVCPACAAEPCPNCAKQ